MRFLLTAAALAAFTANPAAGAGNAEKGKKAFEQHGCWQCHGFAGQGGVTGPKLAPNPMPLEAMNVFVRNSNRAMPPYQKAVLSDGDLADIHAYLQSIPAGKDYKSIPMLNQ
jgi:mono/diheme cytochrome c family protein